MMFTKSVLYSDVSRSMQIVYTESLLFSEVLKSMQNVCDMGKEPLHGLYI